MKISINSYGIKTFSDSITSLIMQHSFINTAFHATADYL